MAVPIFLETSAKYKATTVVLNTLSLFPFGNLNKEYRPALVLHEDRLELRWEVEGKGLGVTIPQSAIQFHLETMNDPFYLELFIKPGNNLQRLFLKESFLKKSNTDLMSIIAITKLTGIEGVPWSHWVEGLKIRGTSIPIDASCKLDLARIIYMSGQLSNLSKDQLRSTLYLPESSSRLEGPIKIPRKQSQEDTDEKMSDLLEKIDSSTQDLKDASPLNPDLTLDQDAKELLLQIQTFSDRFQKETLALAEQIKAVKVERAGLEQAKVFEREFLKRQREEWASEREMKRSKIVERERKVEEREAKVLEREKRLTKKEKKLEEFETKLNQEKVVVDNSVLELQKLAKERNTKNVQYNKVDC